MQGLRYHLLFGPREPSRVAPFEAVTPNGDAKGQPASISRISREHVTAVARLMAAVNIAHGAASKAHPPPRLRDVCNAKAELILSGEEAQTLRDCLNGSKEA